MFQSEKNLLVLMRYLPVVVIILFSIIATYFAIKESNLEYEKQLESIKEELTLEAKNRVKEEVLRVTNSIQYEKETTTEKLKTSIKKRVYEAHTILSKIYQENKSKPKPQIVKMMKDALSSIRFNNGRGYYFIYQMDGINIMLPPNQKLEGKSFWNFKDAKGVHTIREMANIVKTNSEGFYSWHWYKPGDKQTQYKKIGFGKYFKEFDWFIGTGEYVKDFENDMKEKIIKRIHNIRFDQDGYIFLVDYNGINLSHINKKLIGKNHINLKDVNGKYFIQEAIEVAKSGEGFIEYDFIKASTGMVSPKASFIKGINQWQWVIGSGLYLDDLNSKILQRANETKSIQEQTLKRIWTFSVSLTIAFLVLSLIMSILVKRIFEEYKTSVARRDQQLAEQAKMVAMGEMIGNIAHQWRQPLSVISTAATGMQMQNEVNLLKDEDIDKLCTSINDNAQYLSTTIDDFRNFIKGDRTKKEFYPIQAINSFLHLLEGTIKNNNIEVIQNIDDTIQIDGYKNELIQCFINIFNNSKDALKEVKGKRYVFIDIEKNQNDTINIYLKDNAGGIRENIIHRVLEPYFTTKHQSQGTGLGLSMTHNLIVNGMNGKLKVSNEEYEFNGEVYKGAQFVITLPLK